MSQQMSLKSARDIVSYLQDEKKFEEFIANNDINMRVAGTSLLKAVLVPHVLENVIDLTKRIQIAKKLIKYGIDINITDEYSHGTYTIVDYIESTYKFRSHNYWFYSIYRMLIINGANRTKKHNFEVADVIAATFLAECENEKEIYKNIIKERLSNVDRSYDYFYDVENTFIFDVMINTF